MTLYFITGNKDKLIEISKILPEVEQLEIDLPEIQELDSKKIIEEKLKVARKYCKDKFFVEDTGLGFNCLKGFPGPLGKWVLSALGREKMAELVLKYKDHSAIAKTTIGYFDGEEMHFFVGEKKGNIVMPRGNKFGWDPIFVPEGFEKTYAEMSKEEKNKISHRTIAMEKFVDFLRSKDNNNYGD